MVRREEVRHNGVAKNRSHATATVALHRTCWRDVESRCIIFAPKCMNCQLSTDCSRTRLRIVTAKGSKAREAD